MTEDLKDIIEPHIEGDYDLLKSYLKTRSEATKKVKHNHSSSLMRIIHALYTYPNKFKLDFQEIEDFYDSPEFSYTLYDSKGNQLARAFLRNFDSQLRHPLTNTLLEKPKLTHKSGVSSSM